MGVEGFFLRRGSGWGGRGGGRSSRLSGAVVGRRRRRMRGVAEAEAGGEVEEAVGVEGGGRTWRDGIICTGDMQSQTIL